MNETSEARSFKRRLVELDSLHDDFIEKIKAKGGLLNFSDEEFEELKVEEDKLDKKKNALEELDTYYVEDEDDLKMIYGHLDWSDKTIALAPWVTENDGKELKECAEFVYGMTIDY